MKIPLEQILEDESVQSAICQIVQAELEEANKCVAEKVDRIRLAEEEIFFLKTKVVELERANLRKEIELRGLRRELQNERARFGLPGKMSQQGESSVAVKRVLNLTPSPPPGPCSTPSTVADLIYETIKESATEHYEDIRKCGWICVCGVEFKFRRNLEMHIRYYQAGHKFSCNRCPTRFVTATDMRKHLKTVHKIEPEPWMRYGCRLCGSFFWNITHLLHHRKTIHVKAKMSAHGSLKRKGGVSVVSRPGKMKLQQKSEGHGFAEVLNATKRKTEEGGPTSKQQRRRFLCHCGKYFYAMKELQRHVRVKSAASTNAPN